MQSEIRSVLRYLRWQRLASLAWPGRPTRWRDVPRRLRPTVVNVIRLTTAAVLSYLITLALTSGAIDLTGPLTALLVMQASAFSTLKMGAVRVGAVLAGVLIATLVSIWIGLTWWSLGAVIAASLVAAKILRLGEQAMEAPISAMLILGVTSPNVAAEIRVLNTLIGAGVGVAFNLLYPPALPTRRAGRAIIEVAEATAAPLDAASTDLARGPINREQVRDWLDRVHAGALRLTSATKTVTTLKDSRRLNPRALGTTDIEPVLASGLRTLESCLLAIRALFTVLLAELPTEDRPDDPYGEELRAAFAIVLHDAADCIRAFGSLVLAEVEEREEEAERSLDESLDILRETQAVLTELMTVDPQENKSSWLLRGSILAAVEHVLDELNLDDHAHARQQWKNEQRSKPLSQLPPIVQAALPHPERPLPRGLPPGTTWRSAFAKQTEEQDRLDNIDHPDD
ncbi:MAG TPA: FUSC family protein [Propionibacteriaceae bacterium]|nr:FUSC family protein [Propionibacteriaceae bacterium]